MKKVLIALLFTLVIALTGRAQSCLPDGIGFQSQADIDIFPLQHPNCTSVEGDVYLYGGDISNLQGLSNLTSIGGTLTISYTGTLPDLSGLNNLVSIGGDLVIEQTTGLLTLNGLDKLASIGGKLQVRNNGSLQNFNGLGALAGIGGDLDIRDCNALANIDALQQLSALGGNLIVAYNAALTSLGGLNRLETFAGSVEVQFNNNLLHFDALGKVKTLEQLYVLNNPALIDLKGPDSLKTVKNELRIIDNPVLSDLSGLSSLNSVGAALWLQNTMLPDFHGLEKLTAVGGALVISNNPNLGNLGALNSLSKVGAELQIGQNAALLNLDGLEHLDSVGYHIDISGNQQLSSMAGLSGLRWLNGGLYIAGNSALPNLHGLEHVKRVGYGDLIIADNTALTDITAFDSLQETNLGLSILSCPQLAGLTGLNHLSRVGGSMRIQSNAQLTDLTALGGLRELGGDLDVSDNSNLSSLKGLDHLGVVVGAFRVTQNPLLSDCAVAGVCEQLHVQPDNVIIESNAPGCNSAVEVLGSCAPPRPLIVTVLTDADADCQPGPVALPAGGVRVRAQGLAGALRACDDDGSAVFNLSGSDKIELSLGQFPEKHWSVCTNPIEILPDTVSGDTIRATFLLKPITACPELEVRLNLPPQFGDCALASGVSVSTQNLGAAIAKNTVTGVVMPAVFELLHAEPPVSGQSGDTLLFDLGDLAPFATGRVNLTVRPKCGAFELSQTFCWAALARLDNPCSAAPASAIRVSAACDGDSIRFTLKNTGNAPTQNLHRFQLIRNKYIQRTDTFALAPQATLNVAVPADGATWRLEATRTDDGSRTAASLETCGGFAPGYLTAFWQDRGPLAADFDCRQMTAGFSPYTLSAVPGGVGPTYLFAANQAVEYTITFQNPKSDTVHYLAIRDALPDGLDPASVQPVAASHPYQWQVRNDRTLVVEFPGIDLPDSNANLNASRGFFTFLVNQIPDVPAGTQLLNSASLLFDNSAPVFQTNQYLHTIGEPFPKGHACAPDGIKFYDQFQVDRFPVDYPGCVRILGPVSLQYTAIENLEALNEVEYTGPFFAGDNPALHDLYGLRSLDSCAGLVIFNNPALKYLYGLERLTRISGDVTISSGTPGLMNLSGLDNLQSVGGGLSIGTNGIPDLFPLSKLRTVGGELNIGSASPLLTNLHGLDNLDSIGGSLWLHYSPVSSLDGLDKLRTVGGDLVLWENAHLNSVAALNQLKRVGGSFVLENTSLPNLGALDSLTYIGGDLRVVNNGGLEELNGLDHLQTIGANMVITDNPKWWRFNALNTLDAVSGNVEIWNNLLLTEITGLTRLRTVHGNFSFGSTEELVTFGTLDSLQQVGGEFTISYNDNLNYFNAFHQLHAVGGSFGVYNNSKLIDLFGFEQLDSVGGSVSFAQNPTLNNLEDLRSLRTVGGDFDLVGNYELVNLDSLIHLRGIGGYLRIESNNRMKDLKGLSQLDSIGGDLSIRLTASLRSLDGLQLLQKIPGRLFIEGNDSLFDLTGLNNVRATDGEVYLYGNPALADLSGLNSLKTIGGNFTARYNAHLKNFAGLTKLQSIAGDFWVSNHDALESFAGLDSLNSIGGNAVVEFNYKLKSLEGWGGLSTIGDWLYIEQYNGLTKFGSLNQLSSVKGIQIYDNPYLETLDGLNQLEALPLDLRIYNNPALKKLDGLGNLKSVGVLMRLDNNKALENLDALKNLSSVGESLIISHSDSLRSLAGLHHLTSVGWALDISQNGRLSTLNGLEGLGSIGQNLYIYNNPILSNIEGLKNVQSIGGDLVFIAENPLLSECSIYPVCQLLIDMPGAADIHSNAPGCDSPAEVEAYCDHTPVHVAVLLDNDNDCLPGATDTPAADVQVYLSGSHQMVLRPSGADGFADFKYLEQGPLTLHLPQFPTANWAVCQDAIHLTPGVSQDTLNATFLLKPLVQCPELTVILELPTVFRSCLLTSNVSVSVKNTGTVPAEAVQAAVVVPPVFEVLKTEPPLAGQSGDTLWFALDNLKPLEKTTVKLAVQTKCDTFLLGQTLCWEAFAGADNTCPDTQPAFSEVHLKAACLAGSGVRFTLTNTGDAPTQGPHRYTVYKNATVVQEQPFSLNAHDSLTVDLPADGATWRMEATKLDDGALTAVALENCGGLTPGLINAFWLEKGPPAYDFACSEVVGSFDPNQKTALPGGAGTGYVLPPGRPLQYTIDFQNTGTDTAYRVLLRDVLPGGLDIATFRPVASSHPCSWEIHGMDTLEVLFYPIALPDSNVNEPASHGYFSFEIGQMPDLPDGSSLENTASIVFDFNPPIATNTVRHTIGRTTVRVDAPQRYLRLWEVLGNPTAEATLFRANEFIAGEKRFELYQPGGRLVQTAQFAGQVFEFHRGELPAGLYFFRISDARGRMFTGKLVID